MKAFSKALLCLATTALPLNAVALMPINAKLTQTVHAKKPVSQTLRMLQEDPLLIQSLDLSDDEKRELMLEVIRASENEADHADPQNEGLIHKANFLEDLFGGFRPQQQQRQYAPNPSAPVEIPSPRISMPRSPEEPAIVFDHESMQDPNDWKVRFFDVVVVINKAVNGQNAYVYQKPDSGGLPVLIMSGAKVSTGRETPELSNEDRVASGRSWSDHAPKTSYFSNTPTGYWTPIRFSIDHVSGDWEDAAMDHAVFFNPRGIATHRAPVGTEGQLGQRASGACVRMSRNNARELFWIIRRTGGPVTAGELAGGGFPRSSPGPSFAREYSARQASPQGFTTYDASPDIPVFDRNGNVKLTEDGQNVLMRKGLARTLIVVENRPLPKAKAAR